MNELMIKFPGSMERCQGFSIPIHKTFYVVSFEHLVFYDLNTGEVTELEDWDFDETRRTIFLGGIEIPFIGLWGGSPLLKRPGLGELTLKDAEVTLVYENGIKKVWTLENFSGDWEQVTFDRDYNGFLFGAPYDFDFRYIAIT